jgi:hypothetical protein
MEASPNELSFITHDVTKSAFHSLLYFTVLLNKFRSEFGNLYTTDTEKKLLTQQMKGLMLLVMLWALHGLHLRLGRLLTLRVFLNLPPWPNLLLKLQLLI